MSEWQDISTAPRSADTPILVFSPMHGGKQFLAWWDDNGYASKPRPYWRFSDERVWGTSLVRSHQPTHWQPLPTSPEVKP